MILRFRLQEGVGFPAIAGFFICHVIGFDTSELDSGEFNVVCSVKSTQFLAEFGLTESDGKVKGEPTIPDLLVGKVAGISVTSRTDENSSVGYGDDLTNDDSIEGDWSDDGQVSVGD